MASLDRLLGLIDYKPNTDQLWLVGDLVNRGPRSLDVLRWAREQGGRVSVTHNPEKAVKNADCVVTDTWVSMDRDATKGETRHNLLAPFRVDERLMALAKSDAVFMHCLPAHRGEEVTAAVIDGPQSLVWDEAENRLHVQKAILAYCLA